MTPPDFGRVETLFHAALSRAPGERDLFLEQACNGDKELLHEVRSLLACEEEAKGLLEESIGQAATQELAVLRGTRLGPYEISDLLGAGGMGEVYRARDTRLGREVAVKVLPRHAARDPEALARFEREARAVAGLNHPHICALHDVGREGDVHYLVMEFLEGETLAQRLKRGALSLDQTLRHAIEIAQGLGAAHAQRIVHRDLKPGNVMLTRGGAKLLDFGLAKLRPADWVNAPGGERRLTRDHVVAGTPPYMAAEQLEGRPADARTDVFALGTVIFEMATGEPAFSGESPARLMALITSGEVPSLATRRPGAPAALDRLVRQCLRKDPAERWQSADDVALRLQEIAETAPEAEARRRVGSTSRWAIPALGVVAVIAVLAGAVLDRRWRRAPEAVVVRSEIDLTSDTSLNGALFGPFWGRPSRTQLALSPDGSLLVWTGSAAGDASSSALYLRRLDTGEVTRVPGTENAAQPFFSPDGRWIAFSSRGWLRKVPVVGGLAVDLCETAWEHTPMGASWAPDGRIFLGSESLGIRWVPAEGGPPREVAPIDRSREAGHRLPWLLPGGRTLLVTTMPQLFAVRARIEALTLASGTRKVVVEDGADARYLATGHLAFVRQGVLMAAPFDLTRLELTAPPVPVVKGICQSLNEWSSGHNSAAAQFAVSDSGLLVYGAGGFFLDIPVKMVVLDEAGRAEPLPGFDQPSVAPHGQFSPDGRQFAFSERGRTGILRLFDVQRHTVRALSDEGVAHNPRWSPDGTRLAVGWSMAGPPNLWLVPIEGGGDWERLTEGEDCDSAPAWSPDGRFLAFVRGGLSSSHILLYRFEDRQVVPFLTPKAVAAHPEFSPDGHWLAYASTESGRFEVYVTSFPDRKQRFTVSRGGGAAPAWSRDGRRLFYHSDWTLGAPMYMMAVAVRLGSTLSLGQPTRLFRLPEGFVPLDPMRDYELHPDGRRFVLGIKGKIDPPPPITRLQVVHNWFAELGRLSPAGR